jgi:hypothetical protein
MLAKQFARIRQYVACRKVLADHHDIIQYRRGRAFKRSQAASDLELEARPIRVKMRMAYLPIAPSRCPAQLVVRFS